MAEAPNNSSADTCPVDHTTRAAWLKANRPTETFASAAATTKQSSSTQSCDSSSDQTTPHPPQQGNFLSRWLTTTPADAVRKSPRSAPQAPQLNVDREISTIPRASPISSPSSTPANSEAESGTSANGNWIYPSEKMFFDAMKRKNHNPSAPDMRTIVPIHNAVNERAWTLIKGWEKPYGSFEKCGGPKLYSFLGSGQDPSKMTPKARIMTWMGYSEPFDRHDWVVDRCGTKVEYVIDFYQGRDEGKAGKQVNFYLDVRPKLNSWEGVKMRTLAALGLV